MQKFQLFSAIKRNINVEKRKKYKKFAKKIKKALYKMKIIVYNEYGIICRLNLLCEERITYIMKTEELIQGLKEKLQDVQKKLKDLTERKGKEESLSKLLFFSSALHLLSACRLTKDSSESRVAAATVAKTAVSAAVAGGEFLLKAGIGFGMIALLANAIDCTAEKKEEAVAEKEEIKVPEETVAPVVAPVKVIEKTPAPAAEPVKNEVAEPSEAPATKVVEAPEAVQAFAAVETPVAEVKAETEDSEGDNSAFLDALADQQLEYIDVMEKPEIYKEYLAKEKKNEVTLVTRYKMGFNARVIQAQGNVKEYYSAIKNALLDYKGVKNRVSWTFDSYHSGRNNIAKINVKNKTIYVYLALDPAAMADTKYGLVDCTGKKKFDDVPMLLKIKGERKFKYALELIEKICSEDLQLKKMNNEPVDYVVPYQDTEELVKSGEVKKLVAAVPVVK